MGSKGQGNSFDRWILNNCVIFYLGFVGKRQKLTTVGKEKSNYFFKQGFAFHSKAHWHFTVHRCLPASKLFIWEMSTEVQFVLVFVRSGIASDWLATIGNLILYPDLTWEMTVEELGMGLHLPSHAFPSTSQIMINGIIWNQTQELQILVTKSVQCRVMSKWEKENV